jgi:hypothetical protein
VQFLIGNAVNDFKIGHNPANTLVAAVQADIVAHSMGGDVARAMVLPTAYVNDRTFHEGTIHKLITIDTPHLGSPLAARLLSPEESTGDRCLQGLLALFGQFVLQDVTFTGDFNTVSGAVRDLEPDSPSLQDIAHPGGHPLPTAFVTGVYTNFGSLNSALPFLIRGVCPTDLLVQQLTPTGWPAIFRDSQGMFEANDAIVPLSSQENGMSPTGLNPFTGYVHSAGTEYLGFTPPSMLDPGSVPTFVIGLLNTTVRDPLYHAINP